MTTVATSLSASQTAYHRLANEIAKLVDGGEMSGGDRLPSERVLAKRFKVSRTSIREAIIALEIRGIVEVRTGSGIYVRELKASSFLPDASNELNFGQTTTLSYLTSPRSYPTSVG